jgi:hypothetical protein
MAFHVEIRSGYQHARAFNLEPEELREQVLLPWLGDRRIELGDQVWRPGDSKLTVLEGPALDGPELAFGQGWQNAQKRSQLVTEAALEAVRGSVAAPAPGAAASPSAAASPATAASPSAAASPATAASPAALAVLTAASPAAGAARDRLLADLRVDPVDWPTVRARLLARAAVVAPAPAEGLAVLAILDGPPGPELAFDVGLALGALGGRVVIVAAGGAADLAAALPGVPIIDASATEAIAERLRLAS